MKTNNVRKCLREACDSIERAIDAADTPEAEGKLTGISDQLDYFVQGDTTDPEAVVSPRPDTLDTVQRNLTEVIEEQEGETADHLREARKQLLLTIMTLDDRRKKQHQSFAGPNEK